jgi:phage terminase large subunit-like protein
VVAAAKSTTVELYPAQFDFVADTSRYVAFVAGRNSGKTFAGALKAALHCQPGTLGLIAAPDFPMLEFGAKRAFLDTLRRNGEPFTLHQQRGVVLLTRIGAEVRFATLENESRVRGPNYAWAWIDEVEYVTDRAIWSALKGAVRDGANPSLFVTSTPKGRRIIYDEWVANPTPQHVLYRATTRDNPYIDAEDYIAGLGYSGRFAAQEIEAEFVAFDGLVYPGFSRGANVAATDVTGWRTLVTVDVGTRNPTAILTVHQAGDDRVHVSREVYRRNLSSAEIVAAIRDAIDAVAAETVVIDPSAAGYILELRRLGYHVTPGDHAITEGIGRLTTAIADGLTVDPACANLIGEFESYRYPDGTRTESDKPIKDHDHALDALRYAVMHLSAPSLAGRLFL